MMLNRLWNSLVKNLVKKVKLIFHIYFREQKDGKLKIYKLLKF